VSAVDIEGESVAESVISAALARQCDLIVAGAYGRPRLYEMLLGGTMRGFVGAERAPSLLLAH
jgi:nucleotide-binding universal stress UspA family protein